MPKRKKQNESDITWCQVLGNRIAFHLELGDWEMATKIFREARFEQAGEKDLTLKSSLAEVINPRTANILIHAGYHTIEDINGASDEDLMVIKGMGRYIVGEIRAAIAERRVIG